MTRFARAKGSKSSNEKAPEDSTPWEVMKEQLLQSKKENEESKKRAEAENQRIENYQNFLKEQKVQKKKATWCDFPDAPKNQQTDQPPRKKKKVEALQTTLNDGADTVVSKPSQKKKKKNKPNNQADSATVNQDINTEIQSSDITSGKEVPTPPKKKKNKKKNSKEQDNTENTVKNESSETNAANEDNLQTNNKLSSKKKNKKNKTAPSNKPDELQNNQTKSPIQSQKGPVPNNQHNMKQQKKKKPKNLVNGKPVRRKEINDHSFQLIINGKEVELVRFDGFPVMKKDAERLQELKKNMINKGIPKSEVQRTMKLERRRAEKALARMKREVCYNCRKGGHNLSDCPELKSKIPGVDAPEGVCFKCGSTEHKQFDCKVHKDTEFKFATCFICKEPGHIARQCPDNPKGLYPNGGSCKLCGDVTHLRKDCPTVKDKKEDSSIKLHTLEDSNIEDIGVQTKTSTIESVKKPKKIKF
ncbi:uncharacterized protein LOC114353761 [Ostrinia furnacalis]|uniref:uncharacterized protein LOC114353761 n=1 Tax=Ostrinia furnacalis TaxID=93504 RepID=UPI0010389DC9|nr:uncharacterized protein LOC114353761 [Ostrinia furnacalis]